MHYSFLVVIFFLIISTYWADRADSDDTKVKARKNWRSGGGRGGGGVKWSSPQFSPVLFSCSRFPLPQFSGPDYLSLEQANSDAMDDIMSEKVNEVLKNYTLLYLKIKVKLCHSPSGLMVLRNFQPRNRWKRFQKRSPAGVRSVNFLLGMYPLPLLYGQL